MPSRLSHAVALLLALALLAACLTGCSGEAASAIPETPPLLVIALDGADWTLVRRMVREGSLPVLSSFMREGLSGRVEAFEPYAPAMLWTSLWTGTEPDIHGVYDPAPSWLLHPPEADFSLRSRTPLLWERLEKGGRKTAVIGWPAPRGTSPALHFHPYWKNYGQPAPLPVVSDEDLRSIFGLTKFPVDTEAVREAVASTRAVTEAAKKEMAKSGGWDAAFVFYSGVSAVSSLLMDYTLPAKPHADIRLWGGVDEAVERFCRFQDAELARLLEDLPADARVAMVSAYGFRQRFYRPFVPQKRQWYERDFTRHSPDGFIMLRGGGIAPSAAKGSDIYDVNATLWHLLGHRRTGPGKSLLKTADMESMPSIAGTHESAETPSLTGAQAVSRFFYLLGQRRSLEAFQQAKRGGRAYRKESFWLFAEALAQIQMRRPQEAVVPLRLAFQLHEDFLPAYLTAATALDMQGHADEAVTFLQSAAARFPEPPLVNALAGRLFVRGDVLGARSQYQLSQMLDFAQWEPFAKIPLCYLYSGFRNEAMRQLDNPAVAREPFHQLAAAEVDVILHDYESALRAADAALAAEPDSADAFLMRGRVLYLLNRPPEALEALDEAAALAPRRLEPRFFRARLIRDMGRKEEAYRQMETLCAEFPDQADVAAAAGTLALELGHADEAERLMKRALDINPVHPEARELYSKIHKDAEP